MIQYWTQFTLTKDKLNSSQGISLRWRCQRRMDQLSFTWHRWGWRKICVRLINFGDGISEDHLLQMQILISSISAMPVLLLRLQSICASYVEPHHCSNTWLFSLLIYTGHTERRRGHFWTLSQTMGSSLEIQWCPLICRGVSNSSPGHSGEDGQCCSSWWRTKHLLYLLNKPAETCQPFARAFVAE